MRRAIIAVAVAVGLLIALLFWYSRRTNDAEQTAAPAQGSAAMSGVRGCDLVELH